MLILGFEVVNPNALRPFNKNLPITEEKYLINECEKLKFLPCPNCHEDHSLFKGFFWIGCRECCNFFTVEELLPQG